MNAPTIPHHLQGHTLIRTPGAFKEDWQHFDQVLGLTEDLLPVVCNTEAEISPRSKLTRGNIGRVPCQYDQRGHLVGIPDWPKAVGTGSQIERWAAQPDFGICLITRQVRALDIDVTDAALSDEIAATIERKLGMRLPTRCREGVAKRLLAVRIEGELGKRRLKVAGDEVVEFLGTGQQFVAAGSRADGSRYYWDGGLPDAIPTITVEQLELVWSTIERDYGVEASVISQAPGEGKADLDRDDPVADYLSEAGLVLSETKRGLVVACPWEDEHTSGETGDSSTMWMLAGGKGHEIGHFKCMHAHCDGRTRSDYLGAVGYVEDIAAEFDVIEDTPGEKAEKAKTASRFQVIPAAEFARRPPPEWIVKNVLPDADLAMLFGESGSGKSFIMIDIAMAIARGIPWRGMKVRQGRVVYIAAEGGGGFRNRLLAYAQQHQIKLEDIPFGVIHAAPNFLEKGDAKAVAVAIKAGGPVALIIVDTYAQVTPGANENSAEDMGMALKNARVIKDETGGMMLLVHHAGKDSSKGARGWSGNHAAADAVLEVTRNGNQRALRTAKQKDGDDGAAWGFSLETVVVGMDQDGDVIDSCIAVEAAVGPKTDGKKEKPVSFGEWEELILETYAELALSGEGVMLTDLTTGAAAKREKPVSSKVRKASALRAVKNLCEAGPKRRFKMVEDVVFELVV